MLVVGERERGVLPVGPEERDVDHVLDGVEGKQRGHQQTQPHGDAERRRPGAQRTACHMAKRHDGELRDRDGCLAHGVLNSFR